MKLPVPRSSRGIGEWVAARTRTVRGEAVDSAHEWNERILAAADGDATNGTRWGRGGLIFAPAAAAVVGIGAAISQGALAANFNVANAPLALHIDSVDAQGLAIVMQPTNLKDSNGDVQTKGILHAALGSGEIDGICMIAKQSIMGVDYSVVLSAPAGAEKAAGSNVLFDVESLVAHDVTLTNAILGKSADEISVNGQSVGGQPGGFGLDASDGTAILKDVNGTAYGASILGSLQAPVFDASIRPGEVTSC